MSETQYVHAYREYGRYVFRFIRQHVNSLEVAEDICQDVFERAFRYYGDMEGIENVQALLFRMANNAVIDYGRRRKNLSIEELQEKGLDWFNDEDLNIQRPEALQIQHALLQIPRANATALVLRYCYGQGYQQIANYLMKKGEKPIKPSGMKMYLGRARKKLRQAYDTL